MFEFDELEQYQDILNSIIERTHGEWENMKAWEKLTVVKIMQKYKQAIDKYMSQEYYKIKLWASLSVEDIILSETEPDLDYFINENFNNVFSKLMS